MIKLIKLFIKNVRKCIKLILKQHKFKKILIELKNISLYHKNVEICKNYQKVNNLVIIIKIFEWFQKNNFINVSKLQNNHKNKLNFKTLLNLKIMGISLYANTKIICSLPNNLNC